jgi:hypothetical protein
VIFAKIELVCQPIKFQQQVLIIVLQASTNGQNDVTMVMFFDGIRKAGTSMASPSNMIIQENLDLIRKSLDHICFDELVPLSSAEVFSLTTSLSLFSPKLN